MYGICKSVNYQKGRQKQCIIAKLSIYADGKLEILKIVKILKKVHSNVCNPRTTIWDPWGENKLKTNSKEFFLVTYFLLLY